MFRERHVLSSDPLKRCQWNEIVLVGLRRFTKDTEALRHEATSRSKMRNALHTASADILVNLINALIRLNGDRILRTHSRTRCTLNAGLELCGLILQICRNMLEIALWIDHCVSNRCAAFRGLHDDSTPLLTRTTFQVNLTQCRSATISIDFSEWFEEFFKFNIDRTLNLNLNRVIHVTARLGIDAGKAV